MGTGRIFGYVPRPMLRVSLLLRMREERALDANEVSMRMLAPTLGHDFGLVEQAQTVFDAYGGIPAEIVLGGAYGRPSRDGCPRRRAADSTPDHISQTWPRRYGNARFGGRPTMWHALFGSSSPRIEP